MDVWGTVNVGKCWTEEDGTQHEEPEYTVDWRVIIIGKTTAYRLVGVMTEVREQITDRLRRVYMMIIEAEDETEKDSA